MYIGSDVIEEIVDQIRDHVGDEMALLSVAEHTPVSVRTLIEALNAQNIRFMGAIFPKVIHDSSIYDKGIVINTLNDVVTGTSYMVKEIHKKEFPIPRISLNGNASYCVMTFVDGLTSHISHYLSELYKQFGSNTSYFGGGAGSLSLSQAPCVFNEEGIFQDAAVFAILETSASIGVKHGWKKIKGPVIATRTERNIIKQINWNTAFPVYREIVEQDSDHTFNDDNFFSIAKAYPFGILKEAAEYVVRDPIATNEKGELICVGEVPENTVLDILKGEEKSLIAAAKMAAEESLSSARNPKKAYIIDCISRVLFLEDSFQEELGEVVSSVRKNNKDLSVGGALTLGEISSYGEGYLDFFNKTIVVGLFE